MKTYEKVYEHFLNDMEEGSLKPNDKMPSLRECCQMLGVSKTTAENAYIQLAADGYIFSREKIGFFVTDLADKNKRQDTKLDKEENTRFRKAKYDFSTIGEDSSVSCLNLWRRYMKSALRQEDRLLSYATSQGEEDLRQEIARYIRKSRNIICKPEDIVIGAGFQNLLSILIALVDGEKSISFPTRAHVEGAASFRGAGFEVSYRNKEAHVIYVTPAYMTKWGEVMTMKRRHELVDHALKYGHLIIEDDYQNEFVFSTKPTPSLYAMTGGENVAYLGSFSRVLLPSVRISFLILPKGYSTKYKEIKNYYNQTSSKAEQIALAQFLRDGHLMRHIRKMRRLYDDKRELLLRCLKENMPSDVRVLAGDSGMEIGIEMPISYKELIENTEEISLIKIGEDEKDIRYLLSCEKMDMPEIEEGIKMLAAIVNRG